MTDFFAVGESVSGESLFYAFRDPPTTKNVAKRVEGKLHGNGKVLVDEPLKVLPPGSAPNAGDKIVCKTAGFECEKVKDQGQQPLGNHTAWCGYLKGNATATILIPIKAQAP